MRIAHVKQSSSRRKYVDDNIDILNNRPLCLNCNCERIILYRDTNKKTIIRVCSNQNCFLYKDITKLKSWIIQESNK